MGSICSVSLTSLSWNTGYRSLFPEQLLASVEMLSVASVAVVINGLSEGGYVDPASHSQCPPRVYRPAETACVSVVGRSENIGRSVGKQSCLDAPLSQRLHDTSGGAA